MAVVEKKHTTSDTVAPAPPVRRYPNISLGPGLTILACGPLEPDLLLKKWRKGRNANFSDQYQQLYIPLLQQLDVCCIGGHAAGRYCFWVFSRAVAFEKTALPVGPAHIKISNTLQLKPIVVEGACANPVGRTIHRILCEEAAAEGLFIQAYGLLNEVPCGCCEKRYMEALPTKPDMYGHCGMHPFFECRSIPGYRNYACGNCVFHNDDKSCHFTNTRWAHLRARIDRNPKLESDIPFSRALVQKRFSFADYYELFDSGSGKALRWGRGCGF